MSFIRSPFPTRTAFKTKDGKCFIIEIDPDSGEQVDEIFERIKDKAKIWAQPGQSLEAAAPVALPEESNRRHHSPPPALSFSAGSIRRRYRRLTLARGRDTLADFNGCSPLWIGPHCS